MPEEPEKKIDREEPSPQITSDERVVSGEELRELLSEEELASLIRDYVEETFHHPEGLVPVFRGKIFDLLEDVTGFVSQRARNRLSWHLADHYKCISFKDVLAGRIRIAKEMLENNWFYGLEEDDKIACVAGFYPFPEGTRDGLPVAEIRSVFTPKEYRKKGYAKKILAQILRDLTPFGDRIFMSTESAGMMKIAREFGFVEMAEDILQERFSDSFQGYIASTKNLGYRVFVLFPKRSPAETV